MVRVRNENIKYPSVPRLDKAVSRLLNTVLFVLDVTEENRFRP